MSQALPRCSPLRGQRPLHLGARLHSGDGHRARPRDLLLEAVAQQQGHFGPSLSLSARQAVLTQAAPHRRIILFLLSASLDFKVLPTLGQRFQAACKCSPARSFLLLSFILMPPPLRMINTSALPVCIAERGLTAFCFTAGILNSPSQSFRPYSSRSLQ